MPRTSSGTLAPPASSPARRSSPTTASTHSRLLARGGLDASRAGSGARPRRRARRRSRRTRRGTRRASVVATTRRPKRRVRERVADASRPARPCRAARRCHAEQVVGALVDAAGRAEAAAARSPRDVAAGGELLAQPLCSAGIGVGLRRDADALPRTRAAGAMPRRAQPRASCASAGGRSPESTAASMARVVARRRPSAIGVGRADTGGLLLGGGGSWSKCTARGSPSSIRIAFDRCVESRHGTRLRSRHGEFPRAQSRDPPIKRR